MQRTSGQEQRVALLSGQPALAEGLFRQGIQQRILRIRQKFVLLQQGEHQRVIAKLAAVIGHPGFAVVARRFERQIQRLLAARGIAHQPERHAQLHQRQAGRRLSVTIPDFTQRAQRRFLLTCQHQRGIGLHGELAGLRIVAVANRHHARVLQVAQQPAIGIIHRIGRHAVALLARTDQEVGHVGRQPVLFRTVFIPQREPAVFTLHLQQTGNTDINGGTAFIVRITFDAKRRQLRRVGVERREQAAGGLLQAAIRIGLQFANIARQVERWFAAQQQLPLQGGRRETVAVLRRCSPGFARVQHGTGIDRLRRERRTHADFPALLLRGEGLARKLQAGHLRGHFTVTITVQRAYRNKQRAARPRWQLNRLRLRAFQRQFACRVQGDIQRLRLVGQVSDIQRQPRGISACQEARGIQLGNDRRGHDNLAFAAAEILFRPSLRHQTQLAVEVSNRQCNCAFPVGIQRNRLCLLGNDGHVVHRRFAAALQFIPIATEAQRGQTALPFNDLAVYIVDIRAVTLLTKESQPRIRRDVIGNIQHAAVHRRYQDVHLLRHGPLFHAGFHLHRERLVWTHFLRVIERNIQAAIFVTHRQMQQADRAFRRGGFGFISGTYHQRTQVEVVTLPGLVDRDSEIQSVCRYVDLFPPQRPFTRLDHRIALACGWRGNVQVDGVAWLIGWLIQFQGHTVRACSAGAVAVILPAVPRPEAHAADHLIRRFHLQTIRAPLHREGDFTRFIGLKRQLLLTFDQIFLIELRLPTFALRPVPEVVPTLANQTNL